MVAPAAGVEQEEGEEVTHQPKDTHHQIDQSNEDSDLSNTAQYCIVAPKYTQTYKRLKFKREKQILIFKSTLCPDFSYILLSWMCPRKKK